jgi:hypothetical protein
MFSMSLTLFWVFYFVQNYSALGACNTWSLKKTAPKDESIPNPKALSREQVKVKGSVLEK